MTIQFGGAKKTGLAAKLEAEKAAREEARLTALSVSEKAKVEEKWASPESMPERIRVIFDDSISMGSTEKGTKLSDAKDGTVEFLKNCVPNQTAVAIHPMYYTGDVSRLTTNLPALSILVSGIPSGGGTPLFNTLKKAQESEPKATRYIVFSDGAPNLDDEKRLKDSTIEQAIADKTPVDTVLIWQTYADENVSESQKKMNEEVMKASKEYKLLQELAERTGGYFLVFDRDKMDFKKGLKYLAPKLRLALANEQIKKDLQEGRLK